MFKLMVLGVIVAVVFGVLSYENEKIVIDTVKGKEVMEKSGDFIQKNVEIK